jgi:hypothetical protein
MTRPLFTPVHDPSTPGPMRRQRNACSLPKLAGRGIGFLLTDKIGKWIDAIGIPIA